jgi:hypothetical protein
MTLEKNAITILFINVHVHFKNITNTHLIDGNLCQITQLFHKDTHIKYLS